MLCFLKAAGSPDELRGPLTISFDLTFTLRCSKVPTAIAIHANSNKDRLPKRSKFYASKERTRATITTFESAHSHISSNERNSYPPSYIFSHSINHPQCQPTTTTAAAEEARHNTRNNRTPPTFSHVLQPHFTNLNVDMDPQAETMVHHHNNMEDLRHRK
jgi:hypothetical protein